MNPDATNSRTIAIIGANGRLGRACAQAALAKGYEVIKFSRHDCDLSWSDQQIQDAVAEHTFDALIMAAAMTDVDGCERNPQEAEQANVDAPRAVAALCAERGVRMVHISTDYVFDGKKTTPYTESDTPHPLSVYGCTKYDGEKAVLAESENHLVIRVSWLFGEGPHPNATPDWAVKFAASSEGVKIVTDKVGAPTEATDAAEFIIDLAFHPDARGLVHLNGSESCTWQEWGQLAVDAAAEAGIDLCTEHLGDAKLDDFFGAPEKATRPSYTVMSNERLESLCGRKPRGFREATVEYVRDCVVPRVKESE